MASASTLWPETWDHICSFMPKPSLLQLGLTSRDMNRIALRWAFRDLRLEGFGDSAERFVKIAKSPALRDLVRDLTIDTCIDPHFNYKSTECYEMCTEFMDALPYVRCFSRVTSLHLRFNEFCGSDEQDRRGVHCEETWDFRYRVLNTVCHCVAGMWTEERQVTIDEEVDLPDHTPKYPADDLGVSLTQVLHLKELTIANLADYDDPRLSASEAWKQVLSLPSLVDLKLYITTEIDEDALENVLYFDEKYAMLENLPYTWLCPNIAGNLRVLSLYCQEFWGWFPKMDFRLVGESSPFPKLKVLALGYYVFSHQWQMDWFASIGQENGCFGLEELYLDNCPILFEARQMGPFNSSDPGYPVTSTVLNRVWNPETHIYPLRWYNILSHWAQSMKGLKVFRTGRGSGNGPSKETFHTAMQDGKPPEFPMVVLRHRLSDQAHRNFDAPEPIPLNVELEVQKKLWVTSKYSQGAGISTLPGCRLQYLKYDITKGPSEYGEETTNYFSDEIAFAPEVETVAMDEAAYEDIMLAISERQEQ